jgi:uncharacterized protein YfeS
LGLSLTKAFSKPLSHKQITDEKLDQLRHVVSNELAKACMNKLWEENFVTNALTNKLSSKTEQLRIVEEKSQAQSNLVAVAKRRQKVAELELA